MTRISRAFFSIVCLFVAWPASAQAPRGPVLTVKGEGKAEFKPDLANFVLNLTTVAGKLESAIAAHGERASKVVPILDELKRDGLEVDRSTFRANQRYQPGVVRDATGKQLTAVEFEAVTTFTVRTKKIAEINALVTKAMAAGLLDVTSMRFGVQNERAALNEARKAAVLDARGQAEAYSEAAGLKLVEIAEIRDGEARPPEEWGQADLPSRKAVGRPQSVLIIPPSVVTFNASVNMTWSVAPKS